MKKRNVLFDEIEFFRKTGLHEEIAKRVTNGSVPLKDIEIINDKVIEHTERKFANFLKYGAFPF